jgi:hypothetical protein
MSAGWILVVVALWLTVVVLVVIVLGLSSRVSELQVAGAASRSTPPPAGRGPTSGLPLPVVAGYEHLLGGDSASANVLLLFLRSSCGPCRALADELQESLTGDSLVDVRTTLITDRDGAAEFAQLDVSSLVVEEHEELTRALDVPGTPFVIAVDEHGVVRGATFANRSTQLVDLAAALDRPTALSRP